MMKLTEVQLKAIVESVVEAKVDMKFSDDYSETIYTGEDGERINCGKDDKYWFERHFYEADFPLSKNDEEREKRRKAFLDFDSRNSLEPGFTSYSGHFAIFKGDIWHALLDAMQHQTQWTMEDLRLVFPGKSDEFISDAKTGKIDMGTLKKSFDKFAAQNLLNKDDDAYYDDMMDPISGQMVTIRY